MSLYWVFFSNNFFQGWCTDLQTFFSGLFKVNSFSLLWSFFSFLGRKKEMRGFFVTRPLRCKIHWRWFCWKLGNGLGRKEFVSLNIDNIFFNWEVCMTYRSSKSIKLVKQCMPLEGVLNFNVDRVTRGKPGPTDIEGVLCDFKGEVLIFFFFPNDWN